MSDNYHFDLACTPLQASLDIAFGGSPSRKATHWKIEDNKLLLAWSPNAGKDFTPFLSPIDSLAVEDIVKNYLKEADYGREPDHDGDNTKSWHIHNDSWGHVSHNSYVFAAIEPLWAMHGK